jgi:dephospho-CoA kinase
MIVGITGNYCSGKDTAADLFEEYGYRVIDVDGVGHEALVVKKAEVVQAFGADVLTDEGVDRRKLGSIVFGNEERKRTLERIVHPWMAREVKRRVAAGGRWVINAALLVEMCLWVLCDYVIAVTADEKQLVDRAVNRDGLSREEALRRIRSQIPTKAKLHYVDKKIDNNGDVELFLHELRAVIAKLGREV